MTTGATEWTIYIGLTVSSNTVEIAISYVYVKLLSIECDK